MIEEKIIKLFNEVGLGEVNPSITPVSGGFMHRMFRVDTRDRSFAVKHLNPNIMKRPDAMSNFKRAEMLEKKLEAAGIPIVPAIEINGCKMQELGGDFFYIFDWQNGKVTDWDNISLEQCWKAGNIQGRIHAIESKDATVEFEISTINWKGYISEAESKNQDLFMMLEQNESLLEYAEDSMIKAVQALPGIQCITDEDMDPKNVMWDGENPRVIDLECLDYGNPASHVLQLSLQWSGITTCSIDLDKQRAFFEGYRAAYDNGFRDYVEIFGVAYTWIEWLEYNIARVLGQCQDEAEKEMGISEVRNTINRIRYIYDMEEEIKNNIKRIFEG